MEKNDFESNWPKLKGKIKEKWGNFSDNDIEKINGKFEQFVSQLQKKYGYTKEEIARELKNWQKSHQKKGPQHKSHELWSEQSPGELAAHARLAHQDKDPIYPIDSSKKEREQTLDMNQEKKGTEKQDFKEKKRKAS